MFQGVSLKNFITLTQQGNVLKPIAHIYTSPASYIMAFCFSSPGPVPDRGGSAHLPHIRQGESDHQSGCLQHPAPEDQDGSVRAGGESRLHVHAELRIELCAENLNSSYNGCEWSTVSVPHVQENKASLLGKPFLLFWAGYPITICCGKFFFFFFDAHRGICVCGKCVSIVF